jgi:DNA-binding CsgD family transcriptional regulator
MIVIRSSPPEDLARLNVAAFCLGSRDEAVIRLVLRGRATKQVADALLIAENTVHRHRGNDFGKVGVRSRQESLKHLFVELLLPGLAGP